MTASDLSGALFSPCLRYRYLLWRDLGKGEGTMVVCALNCSTADERKNDATISRGCARAANLGFRRFEMVNLFAWRSTDPRLLRTVEDPVGPDNDVAILSAARRASLVVCAWGSASPLIPKRAKAVARMLCADGIKLHALEVGKTGQPSHMLYLSYALKPALWVPSQEYLDEA